MTSATRLFLGLACLATLALVPATASAAMWSSVPDPFTCTAPGGGIVNNNSCLKHTEFNPNAGKGLYTPWWGQMRNSKGNCTAYVAYRLIKNGASDPGFQGSGGAINWRRVVVNKLGGKRANKTPAVGSIAWYDFGHVAYVEKVSSDGKRVLLSESHWHDSRNRGGSRRLSVERGGSYWPDYFLHVKDRPASEEDPDRDGVKGRSDKCPTKKGPKSNKGCPVPKSKAKQGGVNVVGDYRPVPGDFNGDGRDDVFWYGPGETPDSLWLGGAGLGQFTYEPGVNVVGNYGPIPGDFDGDGRSDVLWYGPGDSFDSMWFGTSAQGQFTTGVDTVVKGTYRPVPGDFDGDGRGDVLWYGPGDTPDSVWYGGAGLGEFDYVG